MINGLFVTGTDTGVGKTRIATHLIMTLTGMGYRCAGMKPIACGCHWASGKWYHEDALALMAATQIDASSYADVNPYALIEAIAPQLAARQMGLCIDVEHIQRCQRRLQQHSDIMVIEGVGGILVPLNGQETQADLMIALGLPVILVVGIRLGCLNHALLSSAYLKQRNIPLLGWIANGCEANGHHTQGNIDTLRDRIDAPLLAVSEYRPEGINPQYTKTLTQNLQQILAGHHAMKCGPSVRPP